MSPTKVFSLTFEYLNVLKIVCIPAYNEEGPIADVIKRASNYADKVIVYDDGSSDQTYKEAQKAGAFVIRGDKNRGKIKFLKNIETNFEESYNSILKIIKIKFLVLGIATSTTTYLLKAISIYFLILGLNSFISLEEIFVVFPVSMFAATLSFVPGGVGVFEGGMIGLLVLFNLPYDVAITTTILLRLIGTGLFTAIGMICLKIISKEK